MKRIIIPFASLLLAVLIIAAGCTKRGPDTEQVNPEEKIVIKFSHVVDEDTPKGQAAKRFARLVAERTGGRVEVQVFPNSVLYKDGEELTALEEGKVQIIAPTNSKLGVLIPEFQALDLPYAFDNADQVHKALQGQIGQKLTALLSNNNLYALAFWDNGFKQMTNSKRPLIRPGDFKNLTFRVMINSRVLERQFNYFGAKAIQLPFSDVYGSLAGKTVEGQENTMSNIRSQNFYKVQPYMTVSNHGYMCYVVLTSKSFWSSLPGDIRQILENTMSEVTVWERQKAQELNDRDFAEIKASGKVQIHIQTKEERQEWMNSWMPLYDEFASIIGHDLIEAIEELRNPSKRV